MGSATVVYEKPEDAEKAIKDYHGAYLDDKLLTVEYDTSYLRVPKLSKATVVTKSGRGKTLRIGGRR